MNLPGIAYVQTSCLPFVSIDFWFFFFLEVSLTCLIAADILFHFSPAFLSFLVSFLSCFIPPLPPPTHLHAQQSQELALTLQPRKWNAADHPHSDTSPSVDGHCFGWRDRWRWSVDLLCSFGTSWLPLSVSLFSKLCANLRYLPGYYRYFLLPCLETACLLSLFNSKVLVIDASP